MSSKKKPTPKKATPKKPSAKKPAAATPRAPALDPEAIRNPELLAPLLADPDDARAYRAYAEWLSSRGHPLGELIAAQLDAEREPKAARKLKVRAKELLTRYVTEQLAQRHPLLEHRLLAFKLGNNQKGGDGIGNSRSASIELHRGLITSIETWCWTPSMRKALRALLDDPHTALLRNLCLRDEKIDDLAFVSRFTALEELELAWAKLGDLTDLAPLAPLRRLQRLGLPRSGASDLSPLRALPLRKLTVAMSKVTDLAPLAAHPTLEYLDLAGTPVTDVMPLLSCPRLCNVSLWESGVPKSAAEELVRAMKSNGAEPSEGADYEKYLSHEEVDWY